MRIAFVNSEIHASGGILVPLEYIRGLRKQGVDAFMTVSPVGPDREHREKVMAHYTDVPLKHMDDLRDFTDEDVIIAIRWEQCEELERFKGRKVQFVQGNDLAYSEDEEWRTRLKRWRNDQKWELIGVSAYCLKDWGRGTVIPNGIADRFFVDHKLERDIDVLVEGNNEPNKNIEEALDYAKSLGGKVVWLGRDTYPVEGVEVITNPQQEDIPTVYQRSKVFVKLSKSEGFCLPILEAMASGCRVVTRNMGGNDFCIYQGREQNCVDIDARTMNSPVLEQKGRETAKQFTWDKSIQKLKDYVGCVQ